MTTPQHLSDRYEVGEILGFGGMSEVHLARDMRLHRDVAVKVLRADLARDPSFYLRFRREAQNAAALNHPAIVAVYDTGEAETAAGPLPYIVMEYVEGITLRDIVQNDGPLPPRKAIEIIADACQALNFSHQHGIIHRDVKPANIMISDAGAVKVMDFGIARALADGGVSVTQTAAVIGTAQYLSPEQARGDSVDARSDVYSLGCVLYEIITGEPPFVGDSPVAVAYQHVREDPIVPSQKHAGISPGLDAVVLQALAKNPDNRYQTAAEMRADLVRVHNGEAPEAPKILTDDERTSLLAATPIGSQHIPAAPRRNGFPVHGFRKHRSVGRWLAVVAVLAVLTVAATLAIRNWGGEVRQVQIPDVSRQTAAEATTNLQKVGFDVTAETRPNADVAEGSVIETAPKAGQEAPHGSVITLTVSIGPQKTEVPEVVDLSYAEAVEKLKEAGFSKFIQAAAFSTPEQKDKVVRTNPPIGQRSEVTNEITIFVGKGPETRDMPDVVGQGVELAEQNLTVIGFSKFIRTPVDSTRPSGEVVATNPPAAAPTPLDGVIELRVSRGNQFVMPNVVGQFWDAAEPLLRSKGWTGSLDKGPDVPGDFSQRNKVISQSPAPGSGVNKDSDITLSFGV